MSQTVRTITIKGKPYVDVAERVRLCNTDEGFSMLKEEYLEIAGQHIIRVYIDVKGKQYIGDAEIKMNAKPGTADHDSPISCAQTSALGRALGFASYGSLESIASADEVIRNMDTEAPKPAQSDNLQALIGKAKQRAWTLKLATDKPTWEALLQEATGEVLQEKDLTVQHIAKLNSHLTKVERERATSVASK